MNFTKFYFSTMKGAPVLASSWGSLLEVFRVIATRGFNENVVSSYEQKDTILTLTFLEEHGYIKDQIIAISGATLTQVNTEYNVKATTLKTIDITLPEGLVVTGSLLCKTPGLGWTEVFTGENKAVFRAKDTINNPFYLRIDNSCPIGYDPAWAKFARVTISEGMIDIDDFGDYAKAPVYQTLPRDRNEKGNGVTGATGIYGIAKWYHGIGYNVSYEVYRENNSLNQSNNLEYDIIGDNISTYLSTRTSTRTNGRSLYVFTPFTKLDSRDSLNAFLSASYCNKSANGDIQSGASANGSLGNTWESLSSIGKHGLSTWNGVTNSSPSLSPFSLNTTNGVQTSGRVSGISFPNPIDNSVILSDIYLKEDSGGIRGTLPLIKWINHNWTYGNQFILSQGPSKYIIIGNDYKAEGMTSFFAYKLER